MINWTLSKFKISALWKTVRKKKGQAAELKKIFWKNKYNKGVVSRRYQELLRFNKK